MILPGLVSVTFRQLSPERIVELVSQAGLTGIEWGGDIHVPHGDMAQARYVRSLTESAGLKVAAYGSYYRVWPHEPAPFDAVLETALNLGAPLIRVWAGKISSRDAAPQDWSAIQNEAIKIADRAEKAGVALAFEYHGGTLTDTEESAYRLLSSIQHPNFGIYWQSVVGLSQSANLATLLRLSPWLRNVHVFHWLPANHKPQDSKTPPPITTERQPLSQARQDWQAYLAATAALTGVHYAMLEFVKDDSPQSFLADAAVLKQLCSSLT